MSYSWIKANNVDGGSAIDLGATAITYAFKTFTPAPPIPAKSTTDTYNNRLHEVDYLGFETPVLTIQGKIPPHDATGGAGLNSDGSVMISLARLGSFAMIGSPAWFYDDALYLNPAGSTMVMVAGFNANRTVQTEGSPFNWINYSTSLRETKQW